MPRPLPRLAKTLLAAPDLGGEPLGITPKEAWHVYVMTYCTRLVRQLGKGPMSTAQADYGWQPMTGSHHQPSQSRKPQTLGRDFCKAIEA